MDYREAIAYITNIPKFTAKNTLTHTEEFLRRLGNPQMNRKIIHVAGTNGKGSVCAYLQALLLAEEKRVGMFTSPHLVCMNERICIQGIAISDEAFLESFLETKRVAEEMSENGISHPTFFEFLFGMAMWTFAKEQVDYLILETGLGGRLDATNVIPSPFLTIITSISLDHRNILGDTIEKIAAEKAGIIKEGVPLIFDANEQISRDVIRQQGKIVMAPCREITNSAYEITKITDKDIAFFCTNAYYEYTTWRLSNIGCYQVMNAMLALEGIRYIISGSFTCKEIGQKENGHLRGWVKALEEVHWPGRMEEVLPGIYLDGAHNIDAICQFTDSIKRSSTYGKNKLIILFSAVKDKDYDEMINRLCVNIQVDTFIVTRIVDERGVEPNELATIFRTHTKGKVLEADTLEEAWKCAIREKGEDGRLYCLGSLYLVGMIKELISRRSIDA
ncbi:MAG: folylpolyglutamate synthase/dihydrofolate synthase family protein [Lachnospiraceae bacterium]